MADERHVIDIVLRARDDMGAALESAMGGLSGLNDSLEKARQRSDVFRRDIENTSTALRERLNTATNQTRQALRDTDTEVERVSKSLSTMNKRAEESGEDFDQASKRAEEYTRKLKQTEDRMTPLIKRWDELSLAQERAEKSGNTAWVTRYGNEMAKLEQQIKRSAKTHEEQEKAARGAVEALEYHQRVSRDVAKTLQDRDKLLKREEQQLKRNSDQYRKAIDDQIKARHRLERAESLGGRDSAGVDQLRKELEKREQMVRQSQQRVKRTLSNIGDLKVGADATDFEKSLAEVKAQRRIIGEDITINVDMDTAAMTAKAAAVGARKASLGKDVKINVDVDAGGALLSLQAIHAAVERNRHSIAQFDNQIRGLLAFAALGLFQPLLTGAIGLAGALVQVASSAIMAGSAIGVGLVSAMAQAVPMTGLLISAFMRVAAVMEAVKQFDLMRKQESADAQKGDSAAATSANTLANALDGLKDAQEGVVDANRRLRDAQVDLMRARFEATRQLQDMILAEKEAALAAEGAVLSQEEAQRRLRQSIQQGQVFGTSSAQLGIDEAAVARQRAEMEARRTSQDLSLQRAGSPLAPDQGVADAEQAVQEARRGIEDAEKAVVRARRGIESARLSAKQAESDLTSAGAHLNFFLSELSDAEKGLYQAILRIRKTWEANVRPITDILIESFTFAINRVNTMLKNPALLGAARDLADAMSEQMDRVTRTFTSPRFTQFFGAMMKEAARNLRPITESFLQLSDIFRRLSLAGRPLFRLMVRLIGQAVDDFDRFVGRGKELNSFIREAAGHMRAWWNLSRAVLRFLVEVIDSASGGGKRAVNDLTKALNGWSSWIDDNQGKMNKFWRGVRVVLEESADIIVALAKEMGKTFDSGSVEALSEALQNILIPAFGQAVRILGQVAKGINEISKLPFVGDFLKAAIAVAIFSKVTKTFLMMFGSLFVAVRNVGMALTKVLAPVLSAISGRFKVLQVLLGHSGRALLLFLGPIVAIAGAFIFLAHKFGVLDDIWEGLKDAAGIIFKHLEPAFKNLMESVDGLVGSFTGGGGLEDVLKFVFVNLIKGVAIPAIKILAHIIGWVLGAALKIVAAGMDILAWSIRAVVNAVKWVAGAFRTGFNFIKNIVVDVVEFLGDKLSTVVEVLTWPFRKAWGILKDVVGGLASWVKGAFRDISDFFGGIADKIVGVFEDIKGPLTDVLNFIIDEIINRIPGVQVDTIDTNTTTTATKSQKKYQRQYGFAEGGRVGAPPAKQGRIPFGIGGTISGALGDAAGFVGSLPGKAMDLVGKLDEVDFSFLPSWMQGLGKFIKDKVLDKIKSVPSDAWGGVKGAAEDAVDFVGGIFNAAGGHIEGPAGLDVIPAWLTRNEFVVTPDGESLLEKVTGVPGILEWLATVQRPAQGFASGGRVGFAKGGRVGFAEGGRADRRGEGGEGGPTVPSISQEELDKWAENWEQMKKIAAQGRKSIVNNITVLSEEGSKILRQMVKRSQSLFKQMAEEGIAQGKSLTNGMRRAFGELQSVVYQGLRYIGTQTDKALKAFNVDQIDLSIQAPGKGKAVGGFIGQPGERGGDNVPAWLGRGEAVLNWAHQKMVDPALRRMYGFGLPDLFNKTGAEHGTARAGGFAAGGMVRVPGDPNLTGGRDTVNPSVVDLAAWLVQRFGIEIGYAYDPGGGHVSPGHNVTGTAIDIHPGPGTGWESVNRAVAWAVQQGMTVYYDGQFGSTNLPPHGEGHHAHIELEPGIQGMGGPTEVKELKIEGTEGPFKDMAQSVIDMVREAANEFIAAKTAFTEGQEADVGPGSISWMIAEIGKELNAPKDAIMAAYMAAIVESGDPSLSTNPDYGHSTSRGIFQLLSSTAAGMGIDPMDLEAVINAFYLEGFWGKGGAIELAHEGYAPGDIAQMVEGSAFPERYAQVSSQARAFMKANGLRRGGFVEGTPNDLDVGEEFADGGLVGKRSPKGAAVPIVAHAGEWVVNESQQMKLADALGTGLGRLKSMLGFTGGPTSFAGGGVVGSSFREIREADKDVDLFRKAMNKGGKLDDRIRKFFEKLTGDGGVFDQLAETFEKLTTGLGVQLNRAIVDTNRRGKVIGRDLAEGGILRRELGNLRKELRFLLGQQGVIEGALKKAQNALKQAKREGDRDAIQVARAAANNVRTRLREINAAVAESQLSMMEKLEERMALQLDRINRRAETQISGLSKGGKLGTDVRRAIAETMGFMNRVPELAAQSLETLVTQRRELKKLLRQAERKGNTELAQDIRGQLADMAGEIADATLGLLEIAQEEITRAAEQQQARIDIRSRLADVRAGFGATESAERMRGRILETQQGNIQGQITDYQALIATAISEGFGPGVVDPLQEALRDLETQLEENGLAIYENTIAIRQATIENIQNRQGFLEGVGGSLRGIVETLGSISGVMNLPALLEIVQRGIDQLTVTGEGLRDQMETFVAENIGELPAAAQEMLTALSGLHGQDFVTAVMGLDLNAIVDSLGGPASPLAQQFQMLLQAIIDNEAALWSNTEELQNLLQENQIQQFTSTAWQWFRQAMFTGMGSLLPQYAEGTPFYDPNMPVMQEGGPVDREGVHYLHAGEYVVPQRFASLARALVDAGSMAGSLSTGGIAAAELFGPAATGSAATIQGSFASGLGGANSAQEYRRLREALLHQQQKIEVHTHGRESSDDTYLASRIAFESKIPVS